MQQVNRYAIGLLSGTSIDGIDVVLADFGAPVPKIVAVHCHPFPAGLQTELKQLAAHINDSNPELADIMRLHGELSIVFADAVNTLLAQNHCPREYIAGIGFHGQTIGHKPQAELAWSLQLGDANRLSLLTGLPVVSGFRSMDIAAGGQGAPLAPLLHREIFKTKETATAVVNIGGIANVSIKTDNNIIAFDICSANQVLNYFAFLMHSDRALTKPPPYFSILSAILRFMLCAFI